MDEDESLQPNDLPVDSEPQKSTPYEMLLRQSRKMGHLATRTYDVTKEFLSRDVRTITPKRPEAILFGQNRTTRSTIDEENEAKIQRIKQVVKQSHEILAVARTVILPVNLFPDSILVDRTKVTITRRTFFWTSQVITTRIEDILSVTSNFGPIFGSLTISTRVMNSTDHYEINYFWRKDAVYLKQIIQGYVIAQHNKIETSHMPASELVKTLLEIGQDSVL